MNKFNISLGIKKNYLLSKSIQFFKLNLINLSVKNALFFTLLEFNKY